MVKRKRKRASNKKRKAIRTSRDSRKKPQRRRKEEYITPEHKVMLIILDGLGIRKSKKGNAFLNAKAPTIKSIYKEYPSSLLEASGESVGLLQGLLGGSEVGHLTIGAGRIVWQEAARISRAIRDGAFYKNRVLLDAIRTVYKNNSNLHLIGLLSDAGVHSLMEHLFALVKLAKKKHIPSDKLWIHVILDGRDTPPTSGEKYLKKLLGFLKKEKIGRIATIIGRYYAMDRDKRWDRTEKAYKALIGIVEKKKDPLRALRDSYKKGITDEFFEPVAINGYMGLMDNDVVIFYNFRNDRPRQLSLALVDPRFKYFKRERFPRIKLVTMTHYDDKLDRLGVGVAFKPVDVKNSLAEWLSKHRIKQLHAAESEKYAHVTFFFNGGREQAFKGEDRIVIPSPKVATYDLKPEMSAYELTARIIRKLDEEEYGFVLVNYANPDMVGHTGNYRAAIKAVEAVDVCLNALIQEAERKDYKIIVAADHGNCEEMIGKHKTSHTLNPIRCVILDKSIKMKKKGGLCNIAPTILELMQLSKPREMSCESLIIHK